jgi:hypothetical protein
LVNDQEAVDEFAADRPDEALGDRVGSWCPHRCLDDLDVDGGEDGLEGGGELGVPIADEESEVFLDDDTRMLSGWCIAVSKASGLPRVTRRKSGRAPGCTGVCGSASPVP